MKKNLGLLLFLLLGFIGVMEILGVLSIIPAQCLGYSSNFFGLLPPTCVGYSYNLNPVLGVALFAVGAVLYLRFGKRRAQATTGGVFFLTILLLGVILLVGLGSLSTTGSALPASTNYGGIALVIVALFGIAFFVGRRRRR